jgi:hypothetical protein
MKPVKSKHPEGLLERNTVLILDFTGWTTSYIRSIIGRSTKHIATKEGNKTLPAELWLQILSLVESDVNQPHYRLVYPVEMSSVQLDGQISEPSFVCNSIKEWRAFGNIRTGNELYFYESYIRNPSYEPEKEEGEEDPPKSPFEISKQVLPDRSFNIPLSHLDSEEPFLYHRVEAPDVIARLENGDCKLCDGGERHFCAGCWDGRQVMEAFTSHYRADCSIRMLCPLCVGSEYAERSINETSDFWRSAGKMSDEEYEEWIDKRMKDLGYH